MERSPRLASIGICVALATQQAYSQNTDSARARSERIVEDLASIYRYDSDLSVESGAWLSRFVHLRLSGAVPEAVFLSFDPRLLAQVAEVEKSSSRENTSIKFEEYRFPIETCEGLPAAIGTVKAALSASIDEIGQRLASPQEIVVDGRHYGLNVRINGYSEGRFAVGENERRLFEPLNALVRTVDNCSKSATPQRRAYDF